MIFQKFLQSLAAEKETAMIKDLFSRNLMKCLINQASKEDRYLHRAALKSLKAVEAAAEAEADLLVPIIQELIGKWGAYDFDQATSSKTMDRLLQLATPQVSEHLIKLLREPAMHPKR
jgi:DNA polymerase phi